MFWKKNNMIEPTNIKRVDLTQLNTRQTAIVKEIDGGQDARRRLESLGIRPGKKITKISAHFWSGPVTILIDKTKVAIGRGMARKVIVET